MGKQLEITLNSASNRYCRYGIGIVQVNQAAKQDRSPSFPPLSSIEVCSALLLVSSVTSAMGYVRDGAVVLDKHVEPVRVKVPGHHAAGLDDARLLRELCLAECLEKGEFVSGSLEAGTRDPAYRFGRRPLAERLAGQLAGPLLRLVAAHVVGGHSGNDERHVGVFCWV